MSLTALTALLVLTSTGSQAQLTLAEAVRLSLENNEAPAIAETRVRRARALVRRAYGALLPRAVAVGAYTRRAREVVRDLGGVSSTFQALDALSGTGSLEMELLDLSAFPAIGSAKESHRAEVHSAQNTRRLLALEVARTFFGVLSSQQLVGAAKRRFELARLLVDEARLRLQAGLGNRNDVTRAELELASATLSVTQAESALESARLALSHLIGREELGALVEPDLRVPSMEASSSLESKAVASRPDLLALEERSEAAASLEDASWAKLFPTIGAQALFRLTNETGFSGQNYDWNATLSLSWILYDGGIRYAEMDQRAAERDESVLGLQALKKQITLEVRQGLLDLRTAEVALVQAETKARVAEQNAEEVRARFAQGLSTSLDLTNANVERFEAESELTRQRFGVKTAQLGVIAALGQIVGGEP